jgi:hypothetical protein|tara:strand:+ start:228 stop:374 length:147 start_codon:yes stop_codon:yes gene_type:complete
MMTDHPEFAEFISEGGTLGDTLTNLITEIQKLREEVKRLRGDEGGWIE